MKRKNIFLIGLIITFMLIMLSFTSCTNRMESDVQQNVTTMESDVQQNVTTNESYSFGDTRVDIRIVNIDGHDYVVAASNSRAGVRPGGISIIHSESCKCHKNK